MKDKQNQTYRSDFAEEVLQGLSSYPKKLPSKFFYDEAGNVLFQKIMNMPSYYLTNREYDILRKYKSEIADLFQDGKQGFDLIELGAGNGKKTKVILKYMMENGFDFTYKPIDISDSVLKSLSASLSKELPHLKVAPEVGEYFKVLGNLKEYNTRKKVILFLGSNIGNLLHEQAVDFLSKLKDSMLEKDMLFIGFDQKKHPQKILDAYNDDTNITAAFNKNILNRINKELEADFDTDKFLHWETYDPESGTAKSFLVAEEAMQVNIKALDQTINFNQWESIHTEISQKYDDQIIGWLSKKSDLRIIQSFGDQNNDFKNYLFKKSEIS